MTSQIKTVVCFASFIFALSALTHANPQTNWTFTKVADTSTAVPDNGGTFESFGAVGLSDGQVAFAGQGQFNGGLYLRDNSGNLSVIVDQQTTMTGSSETFDSVTSVAMSGSVIALGGDNTSANHRGIYRYDGSSLSRVVDTTLTAPQGAGSFSTLNLAGVSGADVGFWGFVPFSPTFDGIYQNTGNNNGLVANETTSVPGKSGSFELIFSNSEFSDGASAFFGMDSTFTAGLYSNIGGNLQRIADESTAIPNGVDNFQFNFGNNDAEIQGNTLTFLGRDNDVVGGYFEEHGIYRFDGGNLTRLIDKNDLAPSGLNFQGFLNLTVDDNDLAFTGFVDDQLGIYAQIDGNLSQLLEVGTLLDGKSVSGLNFFDNDNLHNEQIVFRADFSDGSSGVFLATLNSIPEPSFPTVAVLSCGFCLSRRRNDIRSYSPTPY